MADPGEKWGVVDGQSGGHSGVATKSNPVGLVSFGFKSG
jgi:hypothetical protein